MAENEALKRANAESANLLNEAREELMSRRVAGGGSGRSISIFVGLLCFCALIFSFLSLPLHPLSFITFTIL